MTFKTFNQPYTFKNGLQVKNRAVLAPMTNGQSPDDGCLSAAELSWLRLRAEGGFGTLISAASHVQKDAQGFAGQVGCYADKHIHALKPFAELGKAHDALTVMQIFHGGLRCPSVLTGVQPRAPSEVYLDFSGFEIPKALTEAEIRTIISNFAAAAKRSIEAGLGGIEIHGANGYLLTQFMSKQTNLRGDQWGGSLENRARLLTEVTKEVRKVVPPHAVLGVRLLAEDSPVAQGFDIDETCELAGWLAELGIDYLHLSSGQVLAKSWKYPHTQVTNTAALRGALPSHVALIACGGVSTAEQADAAISEGADLVALGKTAILEPEWPIKALDEDFKPKTFPASRETLRHVAVSEPFIEYLGRFGIVD